MDSVALVIVSLIVVPLLCTTLLVMFAISKWSSKRSAQTLDAAETRLLQELHQSIQRLDKRLDAIETLVQPQAAEEADTRKGHSDAR